MRDDEARWLRLEGREGETLRAAVERMLREAIVSGALRPGVRLPSSRGLAAHLGVSRGVATEAYGQLAAQGFLVGRTKSVPVVAHVASSAPPTIARRVEPPRPRSEEHTSELQSRRDLVCRLLLEKKKESNKTEQKVKKKKKRYKQ